MKGTVKLMHHDEVIEQKKFQWPSGLERITNRWKRLYANKGSIVIEYDDAMVNKERTQFKKGYIPAVKISKKHGRDCNNMREFDHY